MQQAAEEGCVLRGFYLVCFHLLKLQRIFTFRHQLLHPRSLFPNTTSLLYTALGLTVYNSGFPQVLPRKHRLYLDFPDKLLLLVLFLRKERETLLF